jgi:hypothetical protein
LLAESQAKATRYQHAQTEKTHRTTPLFFAGPSLIISPYGERGIDLLTSWLIEE